VAPGGSIMMMRQLLSSVARQSWVRKTAMSTPGVRDMAWRFVAGESLDAGLDAIRALNARGIQGTLNFVGTHVRTEAEAIAGGDAAVESLRRIREAKLGSHVSVKLTRIGLDIDEDLCRAQLRRILDGAQRDGNFVRIDMEEAAYAERTLRLYEEMRRVYGDAVGIVLQSYLRRNAADLERLVGDGALIRIVKGGYWEASEIVLRKKAEIDAAFLRDVELLLRRGRHPALATHDPAVIDRARRVAREVGLEQRAFEFQMLYGVREDLQDELVRDGYLVRSYVPYGDRWYEYALGCIRRLPGGALRRLAQRFRPERPA
jgi:proline dehydrogenase